MTTTTDARALFGAAESLVERVRRIVQLHLHPDLGAPYWIDRARALGIDPTRDIRVVDDLALLGDMVPGDLGERPIGDYIPRRFHASLDRFVLGQTGGTTARRCSKRCVPGSTRSAA